VTDAVVGALLFLAMLGVIVVLLAEAHEWAEALWVSRRRRPLQPARADDAALPIVSVHVPAYNEPPEMLIQTLDALASLDYPRYEVIVIDNNTRDPAAWEPVQAHCASLGPRFRFFHVAPLSGFKAGALNFALARTHADAQAVAVIDSDYVVDPRWLRDLMPQLAQPHIAIVQAPQDYRDRDASLFKAMCYEEYRGFFQVGMVTRNDRNAIIQHGTMTIVRREVLEKVGGWGESCITEDAELGLRVFGHGYAAAYTPCSYGRGLMPDNFADYKQQRFRWAYGAIQILRQHARILLGLRPSGLSNGQRYHFLGGWLPWMADGMNLLFTLVALAWSVGMIAAPQTVDPPLLVFSVLPLSLFLFKVAKSLHLYRRRMATRLGGALAATVAGLSLSHTIAMAVLSGMVSTDKPFFRTPKLGNAQGFFQALAAAREEGLLMLALWLAAAGVLQAHGHGGWDVSVWTLMLLVQSLPYLSSLIVSVISSMPVLSRQPDCRRTGGSGGIEALPAGP
jgi:cellulose synthase/poly-beta-1,6-N-acetylglucosamine synthase-like glycosyltransferase